MHSWAASAAAPEPLEPENGLQEQLPSVDTEKL